MCRASHLAQQEQIVGMGTRALCPHCPCSRGVTWTRTGLVMRSGCPMELGHHLRFDFIQGDDPVGLVQDSSVVQSRWCEQWGKRGLHQNDSPKLRCKYRHVQ